MLVDLLRASASIDPVRLDFELMDAVQHCRNQVAFRAKSISFCVTSAVLGFRVHLHSLLDLWLLR